MTNKGWLYSALVAAAVVGPQQLAEKARDPGSPAEPSPPRRNAVWPTDAARRPSPVATTSLPPHENNLHPVHQSSLQAVPQSPRLVGDGNPSLPRTASQGPEIRSLTQVLRFDMTPGRVTALWPQVWNRQAEDDLAGLRVTLVSGTRLTDLAGSLTYGFDRQHVLQRIDFDGSCGDPSELISFMSRYFGLEPMTAMGGYQYVAGNEQGMTSALRVDNARVVRQDQPYRRFRVRFELNRPDSGRTLSEFCQAHLDLPATKKKGEKTPSNNSSLQSPNQAQSADNDVKAMMNPHRRRPNTDGLIPHSR